MKHPQEGVLADLPAHEDATKAVHPAVGSFDDPAPSLCTLPAARCLLLLASTTQVKLKSENPRQQARLSVIVPFIQAEPLRRRLARHRAAHRNAVEGVSEQQVIVPIRAGDGQPDGYARAIGEEAALGSALGPVGGVGPAFFPRRAATSSWRRRLRARTSRCLAFRHRPSDPVARTREKRQRPAIRDSAGRQMNKNRSPSRRARSTGSRCSARTGWPPLPCGRAREVCGTPGGDWALAAAEARSSPRVRQTTPKRGDATFLPFLYERARSRREQIFDRCLTPRYHLDAHLPK